MTQHGMHWEHPPTHCSSSVGFIMFEFFHDFLTRTFKGNQTARQHGNSNQHGSSCLS